MVRSQVRVLNMQDRRLQDKNPQGQILGAAERRRDTAEANSRFEAIKREYSRGWEQMGSAEKKSRIEAIQKEYAKFLKGLDYKNGLEYKDGFKDKDAFKDKEGFNRKEEFNRKRGFGGKEGFGRKEGVEGKDPPREERRRSRN